MSNSEAIRDSVTKVRDVMDAILASDHAEMDQAVAAITAVPANRVMNLSGALYWAYEELQGAMHAAQDDEKPGRAELRRMEQLATLDRMPELEAVAEAVVQPQYSDGHLVSIQINSAGHTFDLLEAKMIESRITFLLIDGKLRGQGEGDD